MKEIDANVKNKWSWKWCDDNVIHPDIPNIGEVRYLLGDCFSKIDASGEAWCQWCCDRVSYGGIGKKIIN